MAEHIAPIDYYNERVPDYQYQDLLDRIKRKGRSAQSGMDEESLEIIGHTMRFDMRNGFPMITERDIMASSLPENIATYPGPNLAERPFKMSARQGMGEILGFINGARTLNELERFGCKWWNLWVTPEKTAKRGLELGDLGPGSYGAAFHDFPMANGETFNQFQAMIQQIKERPALRTHIITPFIPYDLVRIEGRQQKVVVVPCHGQLHFNIDVANNKLDLVHWQRSADTPVGLPFNMLHYATLMFMVSQVTGFKPNELIYQISNAHIYKRHHEIVPEVLDRRPKPYCKLKIDPTVTNLFDFRLEHFTVEEYDAHPPVDMGGTPI